MKFPAILRPLSFASGSQVRGSRIARGTEGLSRGADPCGEPGGPLHALVGPHRCLRFSQISVFHMFPLRREVGLSCLGTGSLGQAPPGPVSVEDPCFTIRFVGIVQSP